MKYFNNANTERLVDWAVDTITSEKVNNFVDLALDSAYHFGEMMMEKPVTFVASVTGMAVAAALSAVVTRKVFTITREAFNRRFKGEAPEGFTTHGLKKALRAYATGIIFGRPRFAPLPHVVYSPETQEGHVLIIGTPGSSKTTGFYIPILRAWRGQFVALDAAGDIVKNVLRSDLLVYEPNNPATIPYNVFYAADMEKTAEAKNARLAEIAVALVPDRNAESYYFYETARNILVLSKI